MKLQNDVKRFKKRKKTPLKEQYLGRSVTAAATVFLPL